MKTNTALFRLGAGFTVSVFCALLIWSPAGTYLEDHIGIKWLSHLAANYDDHRSVVITMDQASRETLGLDRDVGAWPRALYARFIERLVMAGASWVVFNVPMEHDHDDDRLLAAALKDTGNVLWIQRMEQEHTVVGSLQLLREKINPPAAVITNHARGSAPQKFSSTGKQLFQAWLYLPESGHIPTLPLLTLLNYMDADIEEIRRLLRQAEVVAVSPGWTAMVVEIRTQLAKNPLLKQKLFDLAVALDRPASGRERIFQVLRLLTAPDRHWHLLPPSRQIAPLPFAAVVEGPGRWGMPQLTAAVNNNVVFITTEELAGQTQQLAAVFEDLAAGRQMSRPGTAGNVFFVLVMGALCALVLWMLPRGLQVIMILLLPLMHIAAAVLVLQSQHLWMPFFIPAFLQLPLMALVFFWLSATQKRGQRRQLQQALGHYIPERIYKQLLERCDLLQTSDQLFAVTMATDTQEYATLAASMEPVEFSGLLNDYFQLLHRPVQLNRGMIVEEVEGTMLAMWVGPQALVQPVQKALMQLYDDVQQFNTQYPQCALPTRIAVAGKPLNISAHQKDLSGIRELVAITNRCLNLAQSLDLPVVMTGEMASHLSDGQYRQLGVFRFPGIKQPVPMMERMMAPASQPLFQHFNQGVQCYQAQSLDQALYIFERLYQAYPADLPTRFYLEQCRDQHIWDGCFSVNF